MQAHPVITSQECARRPVNQAALSLLPRPFRLGAGARANISLTHGLGQATNVVLEESILAFQLIMIFFDFVDAFGERL
jgi:hypothetical protein